MLDRKVSSIDELIVKKERIVALLHEKRQALINQAVMEGLGAVRAEHRTLRLDRVIREVSRPVDVDVSATYREIGVRSHGRGIFHKEPVTGLDLDDKKVFWIQPGDLVFNIVFAWERAVAVAGEAEAGMIGSHRFPCYRPIGDAADVRYLRFFFVSDTGRFLLDQNSPGAAGRNRTLDRTSLLKEVISLPPLKVQRQLADLVERSLAQDDRIHASTERSLASLREYRQALITAAVTGQIDVTQESAPSLPAAPSQASVRA
jgi:type I restriction enzyme S subunit